MYKKNEEEKFHPNVLVRPPKERATKPFDFTKSRCLEVRYSSESLDI